MVYTLYCILSHCYHGNTAKHDDAAAEHVYVYMNAHNCMLNMMLRRSSSMLSRFEELFIEPQARPQRLVHKAFRGLQTVQIVHVPLEAEPGKMP